MKNFIILSVVYFVFLNLGAVFFYFNRSETYERVTDEPTEEWARFKGRNEQLIVFLYFIIKN